MAQIMKILLVGVLFASIVNGWFVKKKTWPVKAIGKVTCGPYQPIPFVKIELMDKDLLIDDKLGSTITNSYGRFTVSGRGRDSLRKPPDKLYIRLMYSYNGFYGKMYVVGFLKRLRKENSATKSYSSFINFGTIKFSSAHCNAYIQFYNALRDYKTRANGVGLPYKTLYVQTKTLIHGGTPYSTTDTIRIPRKYHTISFQTAKHELAHTIRHSFDGNMAHFLTDVGRYVYTRNHYCSKKTNLGFAFNEGWAEFWANECYGSYGSTSLLDYAIEGNVAKGLRALRKKCNSTDKKMVEVLSRQRNRRVHSFHQYNLKHGSMFMCSL